jgi:hypothetical protein
VAVFAISCGSTGADGPGKDTPKAEVTYKGKTVSAWARQLHDKDVPTRVAAAEALKAIGPAAKSAVPDLKAALKERAWELLVVYGGRHSNSVFKSVGNTIGDTKPRQPTKDEIIAELRSELEMKKRDLAQLEKQFDVVANDQCLRALLEAMIAIDPRELETMVPEAAHKAEKTFKEVSKTIGSPR